MCLSAIRKSANILIDCMKLLAENGVFLMEENSGQSVMNHLILHKWIQHRVQSFCDALLVEAFYYIFCKNRQQLQLQLQLHHWKKAFA